MLTVWKSPRQTPPHLRPIQKFDVAHIQGKSLCFAEMCLYYTFIFTFPRLCHRPTVDCTTWCEKKKAVEASKTGTAKSPETRPCPHQSIRRRVQVEIDIASRDDCPIHGPLNPTALDPFEVWVSELESEGIDSGRAVEDILGSRKPKTVLWDIKETRRYQYEEATPETGGYDRL